MDDLVEFLRARVDEEAACAGAAGGDEWTAHEHDADTVAVYDSRREPVVYDEGSPTPEQVAHIVRHSPARVVREVEAKRRTLVRCEEAMLSASPMLVHFAKQTAWEMATPYRDHPGFKPAWAPTA